MAQATGESVAQAAVHEARVVANEVAADGIYRLRILAPELASAIRPGQFLELEAPDATHIVRIPLSFSRAEGGEIEILYAVVGRGTRALMQLREGDVLSVIGPCGNGWPEPDVAAGRALLIAGGIGLPPILALANMLTASGIAADAIVGAQTADKMVLPDAETCVSAPGTTILTTDDGSLGREGFVTDAAKELLAEQPYTHIYACGPTPMLAAVATLAEAHNIACTVSLERTMGCGFGACSCCNVALVAGGYASCCLDGPVFDAKEVAW